jgi:hypothetical protein
MNLVQRALHRAGVEFDATWYRAGMAVALFRTPDGRWRFQVHQRECLIHLESQALVLNSYLEGTGLFVQRTALAYFVERTRLLNDAISWNPRQLIEEASIPSARPVSLLDALDSYARPATRSNLSLTDRASAIRAGALDEFSFNPSRTR